jgi:putative salt-induced outer membrane protein YdiY
MSLRFARRFVAAPAVLLLAGAFPRLGRAAQSAPANVQTPASASAEASSSSPSTVSTGARPTQRSGSIGFGLTGLVGTTESLALTARLKMGIESARWAWDFDGDASLIRIEREEGENGGDGEDRDAEDHEIDTTLRRNLGSRTYLSAKGGWDREPQNGLLSQAQLGVGFGFHLARGEKFSARAEVGVAGEETRQVGEKREYPLAYVHGNLERNFARSAASSADGSGVGATLSWSSDLKFGSGDGSDFASDQEVDLESPLTRRLSLAVLLDWEYDSDPAKGAETDDLKLIARLSWRLWAERR